MPHSVCLGAGVGRAGSGGRPNSASSMSPANEETWANSKGALSENKLKMMQTCLTHKYQNLLFTVATLLGFDCHICIPFLGRRPCHPGALYHLGAALPCRELKDSQNLRWFEHASMRVCGCTMMPNSGLSKRPFWTSNDENKFESHKQNQTNKWWKSAGFLVRTQIRLPLLTIEFLLVRSPKGALQKWRLGWSDKLTGFPRDETLFAVVILLSKLCSTCIRLISKRVV